MRRLLATILVLCMMGSMSIGLSWDGGTETSMTCTFERSDGGTALDDVVPHVEGDDPVPPAPRSAAPTLRTDPSTDIVFETHEATADDLGEILERCGEYRPGQNYNVIIDGHGTGMAPPDGDFLASLAGKVTSYDDIAAAPGDAFPEKIDHSTEGYFPKVGDQGTMGSCGAFATAYYTNGYLQAKDHGWTDAYLGTNTSRLMSPNWAYNKVNGGYDGGSHTWTNAALLATVGNADWKSMPYSATDPLAWGAEAAWRSAPMYRVEDHYDYTWPTNTMLLKAWLVQGYVLPMALDANFFTTALGTGDSVISSPEYTATSYNHANVIVGYDDTVIADGDAGAFKIVNSWGTSFGSAWGGNGYYWMTYDAVAKLVYPVIRVYDKVGYDPELVATVKQSTVGSREARLVVGTDSNRYPNREPSWSAGVVNFPAFMALDVTELREDLGLAEFWLYVGTGTNKSTVQSFDLELYDVRYVPGLPTKRYRCPDVPITAPDYSYLSLTDVHINVTDPVNGTWLGGDITVNGSASAKIERVLFEEGFEGPWNMTWSNTDANVSSGLDTWGNTSYRTKGGHRALWSAGSDGGIVYYEGFDNGGVWPAEWTTQSDGPDSYPFALTNSGYYGCGGSDYLAVANSDRTSGTNMTEWMYMSTPFDASNFENLELRFALWYAYFDGDEYAQVLYATRTTFPTFTTLATYTSTTYGFKSLDLSALDGQSAVYLAFLYHGTYDYYMAVDDVLVVGDKKAYDHDMSANLYRSVNLTGYDNATLEYQCWYEIGATRDLFSSMYWSPDAGAWIDLKVHTGAQKVWTKHTVSVPTNATYVGFFFYSDSATATEGVYLDDVKLIGSVDLDAVELMVDSGAWRRKATSAIWTFDWDSSMAVDGVHNLSVRAVYNGTYAYDGIIINTDNTAPQPQRIWNDAVSTGDAASVYIEARDQNQVAVVSLVYTFNGEDEVNVSAVYTGPDTWKVDLTAPENGTVLDYKFYLEDNLGNWHFTDPTRLDVIDNDRPSLKTDTTATPCTTGDALTFQATAEDNVAVERIHVEYWYAGIAPTNLSDAGASLDESITVAHTLEDLHYFIIVKDTSGNWFRGPERLIVVIDNDAPEFGEDTTPSSTTTGETLAFSISVTDNIEVSTVSVEYWFDGGTHENVDLTNATPGVWSWSLTVPHSAMKVTYRFHAEDGSGNSLSTTAAAVPVLDNDLPEFGEDATPSTATTGDPFGLSIAVLDNREVTKVWAIMSYGEGPEQNVSLVKGTGGVWTTSFTVLDSLDTLHYAFGATDEEGNVNWTARRDVTVSDNDAPYLVEDRSPFSAATGDKCTFSVEVGDNVGVSTVEVVYWFGEGEEVTAPMTADATGSNFTHSVDVPMDSTDDLGYRFTFADVSGNTITGPEGSIQVWDDEMPYMTHDVGTVGDVVKGTSATFHIQCGDNIGVTKASVLVRYGEDGAFRQMVAEEGGFTVTLDVPRHAEGPMTYNFTISDAAGNEVISDTYSVALVNHAPTVSSVPAWTITEEEDATLDLSPYLQDENDPVESLSLSCDEEAITVRGLTLEARFDAHVEDFTIQVNVSDGEDEAHVTIAVKVENVNDSPVIESTSPKHASKFKKGNPISFSVTVTDEDDDDLEIEWSYGETVFGNGAELVSSDLPSGEHTITVRVSDGIEEVTQSFIIKVEEKKEDEPAAGAVAALVAMALVAWTLLLRRRTARGP